MPLADVQRFPLSVQRPDPSSGDEKGPSPVASQEPPTHRGAAAQAISNAVVRLLRDYTGRGPTQAYTTITDSHVVVVLRERC